MPKPQATLITHTQRPIDVIFTAARTCYSPATPAETWKQRASRARKLKLIEQLLRWGHESVLEHASFTFAISGISRACSHQLVRHRLASYSQQSQRYVRFSKDDRRSIIVPPQIAKNKKALAVFNRSIQTSSNAYQQLLSLGIKPEDARYLMPNATCTTMVMTVNLRQLLHMSHLRLDARAQWEIRDLFAVIQREVAKVDSFFKKLIAVKRSLEARKHA